MKQKQVNWNVCVLIIHTKKERDIFALKLITFFVLERCLNHRYSIIF
jgi:hypothetical protein